MRPASHGGIANRAPLSRRQFLVRAGALGGAVLTAGPLEACGRTTAGAPAGTRVVVVGAGLAGLSCAHRLHQAGVGVTVFEARPDRVGGRCWTAREFAV